MSEPCKKCGQEHPAARSARLKKSMADYGDWLSSSINYIECSPAATDHDIHEADVLRKARNYLYYFCTGSWPGAGEEAPSELGTKARMARLEAVVEKMANILEAEQWCAEDEFRFKLCPVCRRFQRDHEHSPDCALFAALTEAKAVLAEKEAGL